MEKLATRIHNAVNSFVSGSHLTAAGRYIFKMFGPCSTKIRPRAFVVTGKKHWPFGGIVRFLATQILWVFWGSVLSI